MFIRQIFGIVGNSKKSFSLLHLVGLRPRVYYILTNFGGGETPPCPPPLYTPMKGHHLEKSIVLYRRVFIDDTQYLFLCCAWYISRLGDRSCLKCTPCPKTIRLYIA